MGKLKTDNSLDKFIKRIEAGRRGSRSAYPGRSEGFYLGYKSAVQDATKAANEIFSTKKGTEVSPDAGD